MQNADIESEDKSEKRSFVDFIGCSFVVWLLQSLIGGFLYATAVFFTKEGWEKWKFRRRD